MNLEKIENNTIIIFGGTGSLGLELVSRYLNKNTIYLYSRDESKHWKIALDLNHPKNLNFIIGDVRDKNKINQTLLRINPTIIIIAAAMKHIDKCEFEINESIETNMMGTKNILDTVENNKKSLSNLKYVCFISTDKACSPVNVYGMCKAISESLMVEKSMHVKEFKFVVVRYGNVLNSRGSIVPILHAIGKNKNIKEFKLTDENMTRFIMTLEQSVNLIEYAILQGESGDIVIPKLISLRIKDLLEIFSEIYNKPIVLSGLRPGEKILESLVNETQSTRLITYDNGYMHIKPVYKEFQTSCNNTIIKDYNSTINPINKENLKKYLMSLNLI
jgi:UDP-N-acetylglucosamine 4,6-dehydratase